VNDVEELKRYVLVHARGQRIPDHASVLARISSDGDGPRSWAGAWSAHGEALGRRGRLLDASRCYGLARFPFVDGPPRRAAADRAIALFDRWRAKRGITPLTVSTPDGVARCWTSGLSAASRKPLLLVLGGIVTPKEQWGPVLAMVSRLGMAGVVTELPGVGENTVPYDADAWRMIPSVLDALDGVADTARTYAIALSFGGHLALRAAAEDRRLRGIVTAGAPVRRFFLDREWQAGLPAITRDCLAHLMDVPADGLADRLAGLALTPAQLAALDLPVHYLVSGRDEIIPPGETDDLRGLAGLALTENDDVHGSPGHAMETRLWSVCAVSRMAGTRPVQAAALNGLLRLVRARATRN
jgi:esterase FrsA